MRVKAVLEFWSVSALCRAETAFVAKRMGRGSFRVAASTNRGNADEHVVVWFAAVGAS